MAESQSDPEPLDYRSAGVDIDAGNELVERIKPAIRDTHRLGVLGSIGGFGGLFELPTGYDNPVLVSGTDGVGTKLKLATTLGRHETIGIDLVAMCANDIIVTGAEPLFFLDYYATAKLDVDVATDVVGGIARGCREAGMALIGGETAEMPGVYRDGEIDVAGTILGAVSREHLLDGSKVQDGDVLIGLPSTGLHTNGYTLARKVLFEPAANGGAALELADRPDELQGKSVGEALLAVHRSYLDACLPLVHDGTVTALAHITGGGLPDNLPRVLPAELGIRIDTASIPRQPLCEFVRERGKVDRAEAYRVMNMGVGMVLFVRSDAASAVEDRLQKAGEHPFRLGAVVGSIQGVELGSP